MSRPRTATIRDGAALAGVSVGTASKALNGRGSLEGTFLSGCILTARNAARHLTAKSVHH